MWAMGKSLLSHFNSLIKRRRRRRPDLQPHFPPCARDGCICHAGSNFILKTLAKWVIISQKGNQRVKWTVISYNISQVSKAHSKSISTQSRLTWSLNSINIHIFNFSTRQWHGYWMTAIHYRDTSKYLVLGPSFSRILNWAYCWQQIKGL